MCGDCTVETDVRELMRGERAGLMNTDPPYGVAYANDQRPNPGVAKPRVANDTFKDAELQGFLESCFRVAVSDALVDNAAWYLWHAMNKVYQHAKRSGSLIDGKFSASPSGGFMSEDGTRSIKGVTGREVESVAGYSGRQLVIIDEASHLTQKKFEAFVGNSMGGAHYLFMISQPLHTEGPFYDAFHDMADYFQAFSLSSLDTAQWQQDNGLRIEGLATLDAIDQLRDMFGGVDSPFYIWRVLGEFLRNETGKVVPMWMIEEAVLRYATAPGKSREGSHWCSSTARCNPVLDRSTSNASV